MSVLIHTEGSVARNPSFRLQNALMQYPRQTNTSLYGHAKTGRNHQSTGFCPTARRERRRHGFSGFPPGSPLKVAAHHAGDAFTCRGNALAQFQRIGLHIPDGGLATPEIMAAWLPPGIPIQ